MKRKGPGLFPAYWSTIVDGKFKPTKTRIKRSEYPELYRLHRICQMYERMDAKNKGAA